MPLQSRPSSDDENSLSLKERMERAISYINDAKLSGDTFSIRKVACMYGIPRSTLQDRFTGRRPKDEDVANRQLLTIPQERVLADWIRFWGYRGIPLTRHNIRFKAMVLSGRNVGINWIYRFLRRHPELKSVMASAMASNRARQVNWTVVQDFYNILFEELGTLCIPPANIWNADEKGLVCGNDGHVKVFVDRKQRKTVKIGVTDRDLTTVIECISPLGTSIAPMIIFKGKRQAQQWCTDNDRGLNPT
jgi:hypothetical protein